MNTQEYKLDNPVWYSLNELDKPYSMECDGLKFYNSEYCPFLALAPNRRKIEAMFDATNFNDDLYVFGKKPSIGIGLTFSGYLSCCQMILKKPIGIKIKERIVELKSRKQKAELSNLVKSILPTLFKNKSSDLGNYYGIYKKNKLVAALGERMKMDGYTEISSVVTHPEYIGKGYAKQLLKHLTDQILNENKTPFLHVVESNKAAIKLYENLGFVTRQKLDCWILRRVI